MLNKITDGVWVHQSALLENNAVIVQGATGVLLVDPGLTNDELTELASELDQPVVAGFATHPDWDHVLWHPSLGDAPRYGTARCAAEMSSLLAQSDWKDRLAGAVPPEIADEIPLELFGQITALPAGATRIPWDGPEARIIEHQGHAFGHAALLLVESGILIAGDMLSDVLVPMPDVHGSATALEDYLAGLELLERTDASVVIPGHGSVGTGVNVQARIDLDRAYIEGLRDGLEFSDPRVEAPKAGWEWVSDMYTGQVHALTQEE